MLTVLSPGQGSQSPGMLEPWLRLPGAEDRVAQWSGLAGVDLLGAGTTWSAERIRDTAVAQPLLTAAALLSADALLSGAHPDIVCGHSVGELAALAVAGVLDADDAMSLAGVRGRAMAAAARRAATGMAAVLGGDEAAVRAAAAEHGVEVATVNVAGQVVLGGPVDALRELAATPPTGARIRLLDVAGAFHTSAMTEARGAFAAALQTCTWSTPRSLVVANADGAILSGAEDTAARLVEQLTAPVRFDLCLSALVSAGTTAVAELAPGGTLTALVKRGLPGVPVVALRSPDDLPAARALVPATAATT